VFYPDPYYGLNNLAIPEALSRQDYWYRSSFEAPAALQGKKVSLLFKGINYRAEVCSTQSGWARSVERSFAACSMSQTFCTQASATTWPCGFRRRRIWDCA